MEKTPASLREMAMEVANIEAEIIQSEGQLTPEIEKQLEVVNAKIPEKIDGYQFKIERCRLVSEHYKSQADYYSRLAKAFNSFSEALEANLKSAMLVMKTNELKGTDFKYILCDAKPSVKFNSEDVVPEEFKKVKVDEVVDKKALGEALKTIEIPGCWLEPSYSLRKLANAPDSKKRLTKKS